MIARSLAVVVIAVPFLTLLETARVQAQEMISLFQSVVPAPSDGFHTPGAEVLGTFQTYSEAAACSLAWSHLHPRSLRIPFEREIKVPQSTANELLDNTKQAKDAADKAKKTREPEERKPGITIKEYVANLRRAFNRAMYAKQQLTSMTGQLTLQQFNNVNALIRSFNTQFDAASAKGWSFDGSGMSRLQPLSAEGSRTYTVFVYQQRGGQWIRDDTRSFVSNDLDVVQGYVEKVKSVPGWTATTNAPDRARRVQRSEAYREDNASGRSDLGFYNTLPSRGDDGGLVGSWREVDEHTGGVGTAWTYTFYADGTWTVGGPWHDTVREFKGTWAKAGPSSFTASRELRRYKGVVSGDHIELTEWWGEQWQFSDSYRLKKVGGAKASSDSGAAESYRSTGPSSDSGAAGSYRFIGPSSNSGVTDSYRSTGR